MFVQDCITYAIKHLLTYSTLKYEILECLLALLSLFLKDGLCFACQALEHAFMDLKLACLVSLN